MPEFEPPKYVGSLIAAINDGAKAAQAGAFGFLALGVYLLAVAIATTDEDLFLGHGTTLAQLGVQVAPEVSFGLAPVVFVALHVFTLVRYDMLGANLRQFCAELDATVPLAADRERCRQLLANVEFVAALTAPAGSPLRSRLFGVLVFAVAIAFPIDVLLVLQISGLRLQSGGVLWAQRAVVAVDVLVLIWFLRRAKSGTARTVFDGALSRAAGFLFAALLIFVEATWLTLPAPDADPRDVRGNIPAKWFAPGSWVQPFDSLICPRTGWGFRYLNVSYRTLVGRVWKSEAMAELRAASGGPPGENSDRVGAFAAVEGVSLRYRTLRFAVLQSATLFAADLEGTLLYGANLEFSRLDGAVLSIAHLEHANLIAAHLNGAQLIDAHLESAQLIFAHLEGAHLRIAHLPNANLFGAYLDGADMSFADLDGANLTDAHLDGADLTRSNVTQAQLDDACGTGARLPPRRLPPHPCPP